MRTEQPCGCEEHRGYVLLCELHEEPVPYSFDSSMHALQVLAEYGDSAGLERAKVLLAMAGADFEGEDMRNGGKS